MKINRLFVFFVLFLMCSCNNGVKKEIPVIDVGAGFKTEKNMYLSDIVTDVEFVPLQRSDIPLLQIRDLHIGRKYMCMTCDLSNEVFIFKRNGELVKCLNKQGKGPGEYNTPWYLAVDSKEDFLYVWDAHQMKIIKYSIEGKFIKEKVISTDYPASIVDHILFSKDDYLIVQFRKPFAKTEDFKQLVFMDKEMNVMCEKLPVKPKDYGNVMYSELSRNSKSCYFWEIGNDTLYNLMDNFELKPEYLFDVSRVPSGHTMTGMRNLNHYIFIYFYYKAQLKRIIYDKKTMEVFMPKNGANSSNEFGEFFGNDIFGYEPLFYRGHDDQYMVGSHTSLVHNYIDLDCIKEKEIKSPETRDELISLIEKYDPENDNPILILCKLKH